MENTFEVIGISSRTGIGKNGEPYVIENLNINFNGRAAAIRKPRGMSVSVGDSVRIELAAVRGYGAAQVGARVVEVMPAKKKGE